MLLIWLAWLFVSPCLFAANTPKTVDELWANFDPRRDPLDAKVVREWEQEGLVFRYVIYTIGTFKGTKARMAAFYGFPKDGQELPGLLHLHGGGQRAFLHEVEYYASRGYACLSINWGGRAMENAQPGEPNTDWGAVDPTQNNVSGYFNLQPGDKYLDPVESPRNNNWYLLTVGARRGLTFLEQQPEVDPKRLGVYGHSMGGNLTVYTAGSDDRVKVSAPSAGGSGFRTYPWPLLPQQKKHLPRGDVDLFRATLGFQSYASHVRAPLLFLGATNDFHGIMDDTFRTGALIPDGNVRYAFAPHLNHRFTPEFAVTRPLWIDAHLKGSFTFPTTPRSELLLQTPDHVPLLVVTPDRSQSVADVRIYYSTDADPQARFWRSAEASGDGTTWQARLPILSSDQPLFACANVFYRLKQSVAPPFAGPVSTYALSSLLHTSTLGAMKEAGVQATDRRSLLIDDFSQGWRDWYRLSAENPHHWQFWTRKVSDPKWRGGDGEVLAFDVKAAKPNRLIVLLTEHFFRPYRGKQTDYAAIVPLKGGDEWQTVELNPGEFNVVGGEERLSTWQEADLLGFAAYHRSGRRKSQKTIGTPHWNGPQPEFRQLRWKLPH